MPVLFKCTAIAGHIAYANKHTMVLHSMGYGHTWTFFLALGQPKFLLVVIDYIKWIEVESLAKIMDAWVKDFI